jgi:hypothetical protein
MTTGDAMPTFTIELEGRVAAYAIVKVEATSLQGAEEIASELAIAMNANRPAPVEFPELSSWTIARDSNSDWEVLDVAHSPCATDADHTG